VGSEIGHLTPQHRTREHAHRWESSRFIGGLEIRHCGLDCPATEAKNHRDEWERVDARIP
jgi:hypothetical protein